MGNSQERLSKDAIDCKGDSLNHQAVSTNFLFCFVWGFGFFVCFLVVETESKCIWKCKRPRAAVMVFWCITFTGLQPSVIQSNTNLHVSVKVFCR